MGDDSLDPPSYTWQWAIYDAVDGSVLWSANSTLAVQDLWHLFSTPTMATFVIGYSSATDHVPHVAINAVDTRIAAVRSV